MNEITTASDLSRQLKKHSSSHLKEHENLLQEHGSQLKSVTEKEFKTTAKDIQEAAQSLRKAVKGEMRETQGLIEQDQEKALKALRELLSTVEDLDNRVRRLSRRNWLRTPITLVLICVATFGMNWAQDSYIDLRFEDLERVESKLASAKRETEQYRKEIKKIEEHYQQLRKLNSQTAYR